MHNRKSLNHLTELPISSFSFNPHTSIQNIIFFPLVQNSIDLGFLITLICKKFNCPSNCCFKIRAIQECHSF